LISSPPQKRYQKDKLIDPKIKGVIDLKPVIC